MAESLNDAVHFAPTAAAQILRELDVEHLVEFPDNLAHGPARVDPTRHREARLEYWRQMYDDLDASSPDEALEGMREGYLSTEQIGSVGSHYAGDRRLVVWTTPTFSDRLFAWMVFDAFRRADIPAEQIATAEPRVPIEPSATEPAATTEDVQAEEYFSLQELELEELLEGWEELFFPVDIYVQAGANLWETYAAASPRQFAISVGHTEKFFPDIAQLAEDYGQMFPSFDVAKSERLELSAFDQCLLEALGGDETRSAFDVLGASCLESMLFIDDLVVAWRLKRWADETDAVALEEHDEEAGLFQRHIYTLTDAGRTWLESGAPVGEIPLMEIGDCRVYGGPTPWARRVDEVEDAWFFERFDGDDQS